MYNVTYVYTMCVLICVYIYIYIERERERYSICIYICIYVHPYIHTYTHTRTEGDTHSYTHKIASRLSPQTCSRSPQAISGSSIHCTQPSDSLVVATPSAGRVVHLFVPVPSRAKIALRASQPLGNQKY